MSFLSIKLILGMVIHLLGMVIHHKLILGMVIRHKLMLIFY